MEEQSSSNSLEERMKGFYENCYKITFPRRTYLAIRLDGRAFHTHTRQFSRPFDPHFCNIMNRVTEGTCKGVQGCKIGYVQSDEISLILWDADTIETQPWFGGELQKIVSVGALLATSLYAKEYLKYVMGSFSINKEVLEDINLPQFDCIAFIIPDPTEVENYLRWRCQDAYRNALLSIAQSQLPKSKLNKLSINSIREMIEAGELIDYSDYYKYGRTFVKNEEGIWCQNTLNLLGRGPTLLHNHIPKYE